MHRFEGKASGAGAVTWLMNLEWDGVGRSTEGTFLSRGINQGQERKVCTVLKLGDIEK